MGFNLIIQGRNRSKLEKVKSAILVRVPEAIIRLLVTEATIYPNEALTTGLTEMLQAPDVRLTVVINNLGTVSTGLPLLEEETSSTLAQVIISNAFFPAEISRITLPHLKRHQPSLLGVVTSLGAWNPPPFLSPYAGTKGFDVSFSRALWNEMAVERQQVDVVCLAPGQVVSGMHRHPPTLMAPTSEKWTSDAISSLAPLPWWYSWSAPVSWWTGRPPPVVIPYRWHRWGQRMSEWVPKWFSDNAARAVALGLKQDYKREQSDRDDVDQVDKKLL